MYNSRRSGRFWAQKLEVARHMNYGYNGERIIVALYIILNIRLLYGKEQVIKFL